MKSISNEKKIYFRMFGQNFYAPNLKGPPRASSNWIIHSLFCTAYKVQYE